MPGINKLYICAKENNNLRPLTIAILILLILAVRFYYYSGPIFANSQDEGIYLNTYALVVLFHNPLTFSQYSHVNLSNFSQCNCNPAQEFQFYVGFIYPEILLLKTFGFSANLAIYYIIFTSVVEGIFIFLIIERVSRFRAAVMGTILFAFFPVDVLFSTHVQPLIPAMMLITISTYLFIVGKDKASSLLRQDKRKSKSFFIASGIFAGLAYITNPIGSLVIALLVFVLSITTIYSVLRKKSRYEEQLLYIAMLVFGFMLAYSIIGVVYLAESGNYFLYPSLSHAVYVYQDATQPQISYCLTNSICINYTTGYPYFYPSVLSDYTISIDSYLKYFGISLYVFIAMLFLSIILPKNKNWSSFFIFAFVFYLSAIMVFPSNVAVANGKLIYYTISEATYITTILTLPMIVVISIGLEAMIAKKSAIVTILAIAILLITIYSYVIVLNNDVSFYRASMFTLHSLISYVQAHPFYQFYGQFYFAGEANLLTSYAYKINYLENCSASYLKSMPNGTYIVTGGTPSFDLSPSITDNFDLCVIQNLTGYTEIYEVSNPFANYSGDAPPLKIFKK